MSVIPLQPTKLRRPGLIARLFRLKVKDNAFVEIRNRLAAEPLSSLTNETVSTILSSYGLNQDKARLRLVSLYQEVAQHVFAQANDDGPGADPLEGLRNAFGLSRSEVASAESAAKLEVYKDTLRTALGDLWLSDDEKAGLEAIARRLSIPQEQTNVARQELEGPLLQHELDEAISNRRLSPTDDERLKKLAVNLDVRLAQDATTEGVLDRFRLFWRIENCEPPTCDAPIHLQKGELCHLSLDASHHEMRTVTRAIGYAGPTGRIRIAKGIYWRMGELGVNRVTQDVLKLLDTGTLYITSKRLLFNGTAKTTNVSYNHVISFSIPDNGIQVEKDSGRDQFFQVTQGDLELAGVLLGSLLTKS